MRKPDKVIIGTYEKTWSHPTTPPPSPFITNKQTLVSTGPQACCDPTSWDQSAIGSVSDFIFSSDWFATVDAEAQWLFFFLVILFYFILFFWLCTLHPELQQTFWAELFVLPDRPHTSEEQIKDQLALFGFNLPPAKLKCQTHLSGSGWYDNQWRWRVWNNVGGGALVPQQKNHTTTAKTEHPWGLRHRRFSDNLRRAEPFSSAFSSFYWFCVRFDSVDICFLLSCFHGRTGILVSCDSLRSLHQHLLRRFLKVIWRSSEF